MGPGSGFSLGALTVNDGTVYSVVDASATTVTNGAMNVASGATIKIGNLSAARPAIYASGAVTVGGGSSLVLNGEPLADDVYTVIESASVIPLNAVSAFTLSGTALEGRPAFLSLSADGKKLILTVGGSSAFVWTGAGADANFSTPGNWLGGVAPAAGATAPIVFQSGSGTVYNDVGVLKPETITFTGVSDGFEVAGAYGFEDVASVANASATVNPKISVPVRFADTINVKQTVAYKKDTQDQNVDYDGKTYVEFAGGAYGTTNGPPQSGWSNVVKGHYFFTDAENYRCPSQADGSLTIGSGSSVCAETIAGQLGEMEIDAGGAFTAGVYRTTIARLTRTNYGEYVITNELVVTFPSADIYSHWRWSDGKFKIEKITIDDSASTAAKWFRFACSYGNVGYPNYIYIGSGGINFAAGRKYAQTSICFGGRASSYHTYVYPWYSDYTIAKSDLATATRDVSFSDAPVHMMTEDENGTPHTITLNGIAGGGGQVFIEGAGAFIVNSDCIRSAATIVTNGATLAFGPGADFGTGAMTFHAGTTLKFTDGLSTGTTGGALTLPGGDGSVALVIDGETLEEGDYPVYVSSAVLPAGVAGTFLLSGTAIPDPAEKTSTLYVSADGKQLRLLVGNPAVETDDFVWTGAAGDGKFSTPGNWLGNKDITTATAASKIYISVPSDATLDCDVAVTADSITFPSGSAKVTLSGSGSLTLNAIANAGSDVHHSFAVPVTITGEAAINVTHSAESYVEFPGGLVGYALPAESGYYKGVLTLTSEAAWGSFNKDIYILGSAEEPTTHVHVKFTQNLSYLNISTNAVFETDVFSHTADTMWFCRVNDGTLKVGAYTLTAGNNYPGTSANNVQHYGVIEVDAITNNAGNASSWFRFEPGSGNGRPWQKWVIGAGGINYGSGATRTDCGYDIAGQATAFFYPKADYALGCSSKNITYGDYRVEADCKFVYSTTDYYTGEPRTVTMNGRIGDAGTIDICGAGTFVVTTNSIHTGGTVVSNTVTLVLANENAVLGTGPLTMYGGTTLAVPLLAGETDPLAIAGTVQYDGEGAVTLKIGDGSALADGTYKVLAVEDAVSGELVSKLSLANSASSATFYTADGGKTLMLSVGAAPVITEFVWSGAAGDGKMNTPGNLLGGAVPGTGAEVFFAAGADGTIENDIAGFAPKSITFTEGIGAGLALSGNNISISGAITNLSTAVSPVINARVDFTGNITVNQKATGHGNCTNSHIVFEGGVHAAADCGNTDPAAGSAALYGHYFADYTPAAGFSPTATGNNRYTVRPDSSLTVENVATLREIYVASGGAVTASVVRLSNATKGNDRLSWANYGEVVITDELILSASGDKQAVYSEDSNMNGVFKINKVTQNMTGSWMYFGCFQGSNHKATRLTFYFGEEGLTFGESGLASIYSANADNANSRVTFRPWHTSFKLDRGTGRTAGSELVIHRNVTFCTDNEDDEPGRIIVNGRIRAKSSPALTISGSGVFELNESAVNDVQPPVTLTDTATLKFGAANVTLTAGAVTLGGGTTLSLPLVANGSAPVALGGTLAFAGEGKVKIVLGDGSEVAEGDWPVFTLSNLMPDGATEMFELQNETAAAAKLYSSDGKTLRLVVGESEYAGPSVWTGAAGDGKMNTAGNWLLDKIPNVPGATVYFPSASGEIENDIQGFAPASITFGNGIGNMTISGNAISDVWAVTNLSTTANVTFTAPVEYAAGKKIVTYHAATYNNTTGTMPVTTGMVIFEGGVTGEEEMFNTTGSRNIYAGHYNRTTDAVFTATTYKNGSDTGIRKVIFDNSSLTAKTAGSTGELYIGDGSAFTAAVQTISGRICTANRGEYVVTGVLTNNTADMVGIYVDANYTKLNDGAVFKIRNLVSNGYFCLGGNNAYSLTNDWYIGEGGLNMAGSSQYFYTRNAGDLARIHPWKSDFAINGGSSNYDFYLASTKLSGGSIAFITDDEDGVPRTITMNAKFACRAAVSNACSLTVGGSGTLRWNSTGSDFYGPTRVTDTATFAFVPGARLGAGPITVERGAALGVSGAGSVNLGNDVDFAFGSRLAFNFTSLDEAPCMAFANEPDLSNKSIFLSVTADEGVVPRSMTGKWCIATGLAAGLTRDDFIIAEVPTWVDSASPISIEDGKLYLNVKKPGLSLTIR